MTVAALPCAFVQSPLLLVVMFSILGSLFIPFLAATLLHLNNRVGWATAVPRNHLLTNVVLAAVLLVFVVVGGVDVLSLFRRRPAGHCASRSWNAAPAR